MPIRRSMSTALALLALAAAGPGLAADPVRLDKAELEKLLPGRTINYTNVNGTSAIVFFAADGSATYRTNNSRESRGSWTAEDNRYCIKIATGSAQDHCRAIWKTDAGLVLRSPSGESVPVTGLD